MGNQQSENVRETGAVREGESLRVDRAHKLGPEPGEASQVLVDNGPRATAEQVRLQASQLAAHLQRQQQTLDHREAELNARLAAMENQIRTARLWLDERQSELANRELELSLREAQLTEGTPAPVSATSDSTAPDDEDSLRARSEELDRRAAELEAASRKLAERFGLGDGTSSGVEALDAYRTQLEHSEALLAAAQAQWQEKFRELAEQRATFNVSVENERRKLAEDRRRWAEAYQQDQRELKRQEAELANRLGALEAMRADVARNQQESLEMRLAMEELWAQLSEKSPPAALAQSLGKIRLRLAEEFRLAKGDLLAERAKIRALAEQVTSQHRAIAEKRQQLQDWLSGRLREFERQSERLAERERQVDERRLAIEAEKSQWQAERFRLEQELRKLLRHGGARPRASAA